MYRTIAVVALAGFTAVIPARAQEGLAPLPEGPGLAAKYPGDAGIAQDPAVVFTENFEAGAVEELHARWQDILNNDGRVLAFRDDVPGGSSGSRSLEMTATRGVNSGGHLYKVLPQGYDRLFLRFYVKFGEENGYNHHFVSLGGEINPPPWPVGRAGLRPENSWRTGIEPMRSTLQTSPWTPFPPPGIWHFYTYWPEMRSWQSPDGTGTSFYGNNFEPREPAPVSRGRWIAVEIMVAMNSTPEASDGEQAVWIDGKLVGHFGPGTLTGRWYGDNYLYDDVHGTAFEGFRWRRDPAVNINELWLSHYVSEDAFLLSDAYRAAHPEIAIDSGRVTVSFDDLILATEYIGPLQKAPAEAPPEETVPAEAKSAWR